MENCSLVLDGFADISQILRAGVYALIKRGVVIYVGKSKSLYARIYTHKHFANRGAKGQKLPDWLPIKGIQFDEVHIRPCRLEDLDRLERDMIELYKPRYNQSLKSGAPAKAPINLTIDGVVVTLNQPLPVIERRL